jgi:hypothetical protein
MGKHVLLLAGLHKTATTSIQHTCAANQRLLFDAGIAYPVIRQPGVADITNHTGFVKWFRDDPTLLGFLNQYRMPRIQVAHREKFLGSMRAQLAAVPSGLLIVAEGISVFSVDELRRMKAWFEELDFEVRLACTVRHLGAWTSSVIAQRVRSGLQFSIAQAVAEYIAVGSLVRGRIEKMREVFPAAQFLSHEEGLRHPGGPALAFLEHAGLRPDRPVKVMKSNEGESDYATRVRSVVNGRFGRSAAADADGLLPPEPDYPTIGIDIAGPKFVLTRDEAAPLIGMLHAENDWLRDTLGDKFHDPALVFADAPHAWIPEARAQFEKFLATLRPDAREWLDGNRARLGLS